MGKCGNWAGAGADDDNGIAHNRHVTHSRLGLNEDNPICYEAIAFTVPETAGSQRRRGSTDFIMHFHRLGGGGASFGLGSSQSSSAML